MDGHPLIRLGDSKTTCETREDQRIILRISVPIKARMDGEDGKKSLVRWDRTNEDAEPTRLLQIVFSFYNAKRLLSKS